MDNPSNVMLHILEDSRKAALISVLAALCLAIQLTPRPPNVEFTSLLTFTVGFMFGAVIGTFFGSFIMFVNGFLSSWGFAGLNMPFQMVGMSIMGFAGGLYSKYLRNSGSAKSCFKVIIFAAVFAAVFTVFYDFITNLGVALSYMIIGMNPTLAVITAIGYGTPFSLIHIFSNVLVFGILFFPLIRTLNHTQMVKNLG